MLQRRTDLAYERYTPSADLSSVRSHYEEMSDGYRLHVIEATSDATDGVPAGRHLTLSFPREKEGVFQDREGLHEHLSRLLTQEGKRLLEASDFSGKRILFVGLGNASATVDSFGTEAAMRIHPTAHIKEEAPSLFPLLSCAELSVFCPGVSAASGIESTALISAVLSSLRPHLLLVADSLVAADPSHLGNVIQLSDGGIRPGSGIRRDKNAIDRVFAGCPVLSVGFPTAVHIGTLLGDLGICNPPEVLGDEHYLAPASIDLAVAEAAKGLARAVEYVFGVP